MLAVSGWSWRACRARLAGGPSHRRAPGQVLSPGSPRRRLPEIRRAGGTRESMIFALAKG